MVAAVHRKTFAIAAYECQLLINLIIHQNIQKTAEMYSNCSSYYNYVFIYNGKKKSNQLIVITYENYYIYS